MSDGDLDEPNDYFDGSAGWYWATQVILTLYGAGAIAYTVLVQNNSVTNTFFHALPFGTYYTLQYTSFLWIAYMLGTMRLLMYIILSLAILYRRSRACGSFWYVFVALIALADMITIVGLSPQYTNCNLPGQPDNPCNDVNYCCAPDVFNNAASLCLFTGLCSGVTNPISLRPNPIFLWTFYSSLAFLIVDLYFVFFLAGIACLTPFTLRLKIALRGSEKQTKGQ